MSGSCLPISPYFERCSPRANSFDPATPNHNRSMYAIRCHRFEGRESLLLLSFLSTLNLSRVNCRVKDFFTFLRAVLLGHCGFDLLSLFGQWHSFLRLRSNHRSSSHRRKSLLFRGKFLSTARFRGGFPTCVSCLSPAICRGR